MSKTIKQKKIDPINVPRQLRYGLDEAVVFLEEKNPQQALDLLLGLNKKYPHNWYVLSEMLNAYIDLGDNRSYLYTIYELYSLDPNNADLKLGLAGSYLTNGYLPLALITFRQFLEKWPDHENVPAVLKTIARIEPELEKMVNAIHLTLEKDLAFLSKHEEARFFMDKGEYEHSKSLIQRLLKDRPTFTPLLNNLCQIYWQEGKTTRAIEIGFQVIEIDPENIHALSNLTRYMSIQGKKEEALALAQRLRDSKAGASERWLKISEGLAFASDDAGLLTLLEQAKSAAESKYLPGLFWHWCAASEYRRGNIAGARANWQKCLQLEPDFQRAAANLAALKQPLHERTCPQVFTINEWLPAIVLDEWVTLAKLVVNSKNKAPSQQKLQAFCLEHPEVLQTILTMLQEGDSQSQEFVIKQLNLAAYPAIHEHLKSFATSQFGPDELRMRVAQILRKHGALENDEIKIWSRGEWRTVMLLSFDITPEPIDDYPLKPGVRKLMVLALDALHMNDGVEAEKLLRKALNTQPNHPGLHNNLALALILQGKNAEAETISIDIAKRFPDYFFGQIGAANLATRDGDLEKARLILNTLMKKQRWHVTEFTAFCQSQINLLIMENKTEAINTWLQLWEQTCPDDPALENYKKTKILFDAMNKLKSESFGHSRSKRTRR